MNITITERERKLLEDQKSHEEVCIRKYNSYAAQAKDPELKQMFQAFAAQEQEHLNTINQMLAGTVPDMQQGQQKQAQQQGQQVQGGQNTMADQGDEVLCRDLLMTEKYVSGAYNTAIFEFSDTNARQTLNHIQKEEQQHGEGIMNYMKKKGIYQN
jgi:spore coat protein CotF